MRTRARCLAVLLIAVAGTAAGAAEPDYPLSLPAYLEWLEGQGLALIYSDDLVDPSMRIAAAPACSEPLGCLLAAVEPFGLAVRSSPSGSLLIVRGEAAPAEAAAEDPAADEEPIIEIVVTSSLHRLDYGSPETHTYFDRELATRLPVVADEALRLTNRLPGTASGGVSARTHVRGGEQNEVLYLFDGLRLYEPFHLRDFQSITMIVNSSAMAGLDFYTGAFPARYGDRMSAVTDIEMREPVSATETEIAASFFNASVLSMGRLGAADEGGWLVSARRGNLDLVADAVDPAAGDPDYEDFLAHFEWTFDERAEIAANVLVSRDRIDLADADRGEFATADYDNRVGWLKWRATWSERLSSEAVIALSRIRENRSGSVTLPAIVSGALLSRRDFDALQVRQDWRFAASRRWSLGFGFDVKDLDAVYDFSSSRTLTPPFDTLFDNEPTTERDFRSTPAGAQYAVYADLRIAPREKLVLELGLRWDQQTYTTASDDKQYSPRVSVLYTPHDDTEWRLGWGRYYQAQEINELQVTDGVDTFFPAERAEHLVLNLKKRLVSDIELDVSFYRKRFRTLAPRFVNVFNGLTLLPELAFDRVRIAASGAEALGAELTLMRGADADALFWWFGYAWSEIEDLLPEGRVKRGWDQTHTLRGGLSFRWRAWDFSAAAEVHTGWPKTSLVASTGSDATGNPTLELAATERDASRYSVFHTLDLRISRRFDPGPGTLTAYLDVSNAYGRENPCCLEYSIDPEAFGAARLAVRERHWLPLVPSLGFVWNF